jgi:tetratricopeptide (TPR) repeat protein
MFEAALALHRQRRLREAEQGYRAVLKAEPQHFGALHHLGVVHAQRGRVDKAIRLMRQALASDPNAAEVLNDLGVALEKANRLEEAVETYERAVALKLGYAEAHHNLGNCLQVLQRHEAALLHLEKALTLRPTAETNNNLGVSLKVLRRHQDAIVHFEKALALRPTYPEASNNLGSALQALERHDEAILQFQRALDLRPGFVEAQYNLGNSLYQANRLDEAVLSYERVIAIQPSHAKAHSNLGYAFGELGHHEEAVAIYRRAAAIDPSDAEAYYNLGTGLQALNRHEESLAWFKKALKLNPELPKAHWNESRARLVLGDFVQGWKKFEWRWRYNLSRRDFEQPLWLGETDITGKTLLVHAEQGLGDTLQFCRYVPLIRNRAPNVVFEVQPELLELLRGSLAGPGLIVVARGHDELPWFDLQCPLLSLPLACGTVLETIPRAIPYLKPDPERRDGWAQWTRSVPKGPRVGLVWAGNPKLGLHKKFQRSDARRSVRLSALRRLFDIANVTIVSLQKGGAAVAQVLDAGLPILDRTDDLHSFADTAALVSDLDLVITVDTSVAHLAGGLGKPVWMLSRFDGCWRWLLDREDSPWYPTMRIFRQPAPGDWDPVISRVADDLTKFALGDDTVLRPALRAARS